MNRSVIKLYDVKKKYNGSSNQKVFSKINLEIYSGELIAVKGVIGSGKTTLLNLISGLVKPDSGRIYVDRYDITSMKQNSLALLRANIFGIVPQIHNLIPELTIAQNLELPLIIKGIKKEKRITIVNEAQEKIGIINMSKRLAGTLSVGESTIISIMRSMITNPPILLMDEPTEGLDPIIAEMILSLIRGYSLLNNKTILITTHDNRILSIADRIIQVQQQIP